jgi:hypothetical protein
MMTQYFVLNQKPHIILLRNLKIVSSLHQRLPKREIKESEKQLKHQHRIYFLAGALWRGIPAREL